MDYITCQSPLSMGFSRQEYWNGLPFPSPRDLPDPGFKPRSPALQVDSLPTEPQAKPSIFLAKGKLNSLSQKKESYCIREHQLT